MLPFATDLLQRFQVPGVEPESFFDRDDLPSWIILDVRSPGEFEAFSIPTAVNLPILDNQERHEVGWIYKNIAKERAYETALQFAEPKLKPLFQWIHANQHRPVLVHCWRGGGRSAHVAAYLKSCFPNAQIFQLKGGIKAYRRWMLAQLDDPNFYPPFLTVSGLTGSGKSKLLEEASAQNASVLHLEELAQHMSSVFGAIPYGHSSSQKVFEQRLFHTVRDIQAKRRGKGRVLIEAESRRIGQVLMPEALSVALHQAPHVEIQAPLEFRVRNLMGDYLTGEADRRSQIRAQLKQLESRLGTALYRKLDQLLVQERFEVFVEELLLKHYDRVYKRFSAKPVTTLICQDEATVKLVANQLVEMTQHEEISDRCASSR